MHLGGGSRLMYRNAACTLTRCDVCLARFAFYYCMPLSHFFEYHPTHIYTPTSHTGDVPYTLRRSLQSTRLSWMEYSFAMRRFAIAYELQRSSSIRVRMKSTKHSVRALTCSRGPEGAELSGRHLVDAQPRATTTHSQH